MEDKILKLLGRADYAPGALPELARALRLGRHQQPELEACLQQLEKRGLIARTKNNRYIQSREADLIPGVIRINRQGKGFLQPDDPALTEITVPESATGTALNGDRVLVRREVPAPARQPAREGEIFGAVVRILESKRTQLVGTLQRSRQFLYVIPDDPRIPHNIYVPPPRDVGRPAYPGDKVVVELREWVSRHTNPEGEIIEVLGAPDAEGVDMLSVLRQYNLPLHFPKNVLHEAEEIARNQADVEADAAELRRRTDCRDHDVITIDPDDAKDFDDAICLKCLGRDRWKLWVHIADVSHYVRPGSALDTEARERGNSTYLVDRVIPMLPEALSNELCSLKPEVPRLTKCVEFLLTSYGRVLETKFYPAIIRSKRRFTYQEALAILQKPPTTEMERMLHQAHEMAQRIRRERFKQGALELDFPETKIRLDDHGRVVRLDRLENDISHQLIEEYMLLANEAVATRLISLNRPAVHRVHEAPAERRLNEFREDVLSHHIPCGNLRQRPEIQKLLQRLQPLAIGPALKIGFLRSLMRARYLVEPLGHFGLNKPKYTHFTSPIRRYADLVVHRALFDAKPLDPRQLREIADHLSETERNSSDAERDSRDVKLFAYLGAQLRTGKLQTYSALVTDVRNFGFFVEVTDVGLSGLVHLSSVEDDFFTFDAGRAQLTGRRTRRIIQIGDRVMVRVYKVDTFKKQVDFQLVPTGAAKGKAIAARPPAGGRPRSPQPERQSGQRPAQRPGRQQDRQQSPGPRQRPRKNFRGSGKQHRRN